ncbi:beta-lactamase/transpeptidase-like protein, partial [Cutaneotrichosporon oleaginosum]
MPNSPKSLRLKLDGFVTIQSALTAASKALGTPTTLALADANGVLLECEAGPFDPLHPERGVRGDDIMWFASTTKLLTSICYLQLVDAGKLTLDTNMRVKFPALDAAASHIIKGFDDDCKPILEKNEAPVTLLQLLNQTSGFGMEFGDKIPRWKKVAEKGTGFVNSCKIENLVNTPLCFAPGTDWSYGNSAEWLGLILPTLVGTSTEEYFQTHLLRPLGMADSSFYPDNPEWADRLVPLRFRSESGFERLKDQMPLLTLPRKREDIEYPVAGGGIYSTSADYIRVLQHLLQHRLSLAGRAPRPKTTLLSDTSLSSLFTGTLPDAALSGIAKMFDFQLGGEEFVPGEASWSTGMGVYAPKDGRRRGGYGRLSGSVGWGGAAGTQYWIDETSGIAAVFTTQILPGSTPATKAFKDEMERAIYEAL